MAPRVCLFVLLLISLAYRTAVSACTPPASTPSANHQYAFLSAHDDASEPNDYLYIGGVFGVHEAGGTPGECGEIRTRGVHNLEAFLWAVKTYKTRYPGNQLQEVNIGALAFDSCSSSFKVQQQVANFRDCVVGYGTPVVPPASLLAYVGPDRSAEAVALAAFQGPQGPTLVSHAATSAQLADRDAFPRFLRTVPPDTAQVRAIVELLVRQDWKVVQLVHSDDVYGESGRDAFLGAARDAGVCVVNAQVAAAMDTDMDAIVTSLLDNEETRAVVLFTTGDVARRILQAATEANTRGLFTWFGTTAWPTDESVVEEVEETAEGAVTLSLDTTAAALQFTNYFYGSNPAESPEDPWFEEYWSEKFKCYFPDDPTDRYNTLCDPVFSPSQSLQGVAMDVYVPYTILAVDAILNGIGRKRMDLCERSSRKLCDAFLQGNPLSRVFDGVSGVLEPLVFNASTGSPTESTYTIFNYRTGYGSCAGHCYVEIGDYNTARDELRVSELEIYGATGKRIPGTTSVCGESPCTACGETTPNVTAGPPPGASVGGGGGRPTLAMRSDGWIIALVVLAALGIVLVIVLEVFLMTKIYATPYVKHWRSMWLGQLLLVAILLSYLTLFAFVPTPTAASCGIIRFAVGVCYAMCFSILLVKLMIILSSKSVGYLKGIFQVLMFFFAWAVQIAADTQWLILHPPGVAPSPTDPDQWVCVNNAFQDHVMSLIYVMVLIVICTVVAIKTHGISTNHREGVFIGLSAGFAIPIWIAWILLGMLIDNPEFQDPCLAFGLFATTTLIMFNMYLPKVRQLNSMGVEGIYAEDDTPDYDPSLVAPAASIVGPLPSQKQQTLATYAPSTTLGYAPSVTGYAPSVAGYAPSVTGYPPSKPGSVILIPNGDMYTEAKPAQHHKPNPNALYLRHDKGRMRSAAQTLDSTSVRSAPIYQGQYVMRRPPAGRDNIYATTRVLRMSNELTGRKTILGDDVVQPSDQNENIYYGTARSERSRGSGGNNGQATLTRANRSVQDLGSL